MDTSKKSWRTKLHVIIYGTNTPAGKLFDIVLLIVIIASIILVMLESVKEIDARFHKALDIAEWVVTILFTLEYIARILTVKKPLKYITSFYGIIDLLSTIPKYLSLILTGTQSLVALRALRLLRIFRILKIARFVGASNNLARAMRASRPKIAVFLFFVMIVCVILGTIMYLVEGDESGFTSIPRAVYWCIVTLTTVGFGDIAPITPLGQFIASLIMILGYGIIAVPTGIVSAEYTSQSKEDAKEDDAVFFSHKTCTNCLAESHKTKAKYCYRCGHDLDEL